MVINLMGNHLKIKLITVQRSVLIELMSVLIQLINVGDSLISPSLSFSNPVYQTTFHLHLRGMHSIAFTQEGRIWTKGTVLLLLSQRLIAMWIGNIPWAWLGELWMSVSDLVQIEVPVSALFVTALSCPSVNRLLSSSCLLIELVLVNKTSSPQF